MKRILLNLGGYAVTTVCLLAIGFGSASAGWVKGEFTVNGRPVTEYHCMPDGKAPYPAVILLHGAGPRDRGNSALEKICGDLAAAGYYTEFIEYYSQTEDVTPGQPAKIKELFPVWMAEIRGGLEAMDQNPQVDPRRIGMVGYSLGAFLSLSTGATSPGKIAAIVEYYGGLPPAMHSMAGNLPPTLILHGDADQLVPVSQAHELDDLMTKAKRPHEIQIYPSANHAFNFKIPVWYNAADAEEAWTRTLAFLAKYLKEK
jgi:carboxymethylenebutenolidase